MSIVYGLAEYDRFTGMVDSNINLPMDGVGTGNLYEFFQSAGKNGWELCGTFSAGQPGQSRALPPGFSGKRTCEDAAEEIAFVFKRVKG